MSAPTPRPGALPLAEELDALDVQITEVTTSIASERKALQQHVPSGITFDKFLALADDAQINAKILAKGGQIKAADQATTIAGKPLLKVCAIPELPQDFLDLMQKTIAGVSASAVKQLEDHLAKHKFGDDGEAWPATGLAHIHDDSCPFCANSLTGNKFVELYKQYFDQTYADFITSLNSQLSDLDVALSEAAALKVQAHFKELASEAEYWTAFGDVGFVSAPDGHQIAQAIAPVYAEARRVLDLKIASPLEKQNTARLEALHTTWQAMRAALEASNASIANVNASIQTIKTSTASVSKAILQKELSELQTIRKRYEPAVVTLATSYSELVTEKEIFVRQKEKKKDELDTYDAAALPKYHAAINKYLSQFGAGFSLMKSEKTYIGKAPQWIYTIEINKHAVDITQKAGLGEPSFQTAMSAGDRSTLALRRVMTAKSIFRIGSSASQVLVLSHDKHFLKDVSDKILGGVTCATFQISTSKQNSSIEPWNLEREVKEGYLQAHMDMQDFHDSQTNDAKAMRTLMRPLLEKYIRYRFPNQIPDGKWLGEMLSIVAADSDHPLQAVYSEIDDINQYTAPFHHDPNTPFDPDEVRAFVARTLAVVGGC